MYDSPSCCEDKDWEQNVLLESRSSGVSSLSTRVGCSDVFEPRWRKNEGTQEESIDRGSGTEELPGTGTGGVSEGMVTNVARIQVPRTLKLPSNLSGKISEQLKCPTGEGNIVTLQVGYCMLISNHGA